MKALFALVALLLEGCGGGGGSSPSVVPPIVAAVQRPDLLFCYFGIMGAQIKETAAHVNALFAMAWNFENWTPTGRPWIADWMLTQLEEARAAGINNFILDVGPWIFDPKYKYEGVAALTPFVERLKAAGLWGYVVALYPVDEPDLPTTSIADATMNQVNTDLKVFGKPVACCYGQDRKWPGIGTVDWAGFDKYGVDVNGDGLLAELKRKLRPEQRIMLFAGGADPWRDNVRPVLMYANGDKQVVAIVAFIYGAHGGNKGIRDNGMQPEYAEVGSAIKNAKVSSTGALSAPLGAPGSVKRQPRYGSLPAAMVSPIVWRRNGD